MVTRKGIIVYCTPIEVWENDELTIFEERLFALLCSLDISEHGCYASNAYLARHMKNVSISTVIRAINHLIELEYLTREVFVTTDKGSIRILRINTGYLSKYRHLKYKANKLPIDKEDDQEVELQIGGDSNQAMGGDSSHARQSYIKNNKMDSSVIMKHDTLLRNVSVSQLPSESVTSPVGDVELKVRSKLIRRQSSLIKNTPIIAEEFEPPKLIEPFLSKEVELVVNEWEDGLKIHAHHTKTFHAAALCIKKLLQGTFFNNVQQFEEYKDRKFTVDEIISSISNFKLAALSQDYHPLGNLKEIFSKTSFPRFFYNPFSVKFKSIFIEYVNHQPKPVDRPKKLIPDAYPDISKRLRKLYSSNVLGDPDADLLPQAENSFRRAALKLVAFKEKHKRRIIIREVNGSFTDYLWEALERKAKNPSDITPYWFSSDITFQETFPAFLYDQGVLSSLNKKEFSLYN